MSEHLVPAIFGGVACGAASGHAAAAPHDLTARDAAAAPHDLTARDTIAAPHDLTTGDTTAAPHDLTTGDAAAVAGPCCRSRAYGVRRCASRGILASILVCMALLVSAIPQALALDDIQRTFTYLRSTGGASLDIPAHLEAEGITYELEQISEPAIDAEWDAPVETIERTIERSFDSADEAAVRASFDSALPVEEFISGYTGALTLSGLDVRPRYTPVQRQVDRLVSYSGLPDNDVARIPASRTFEVTSFGDGADTVETGTLALSDIAYAVERTDEFGLPVSYRADCCYRGQESYSVVTGYDAVAVYRGECPVDDAMMKVSATYRPQPPLALTVSTTNTPTTAPTTATAPVQAVEETVEPVPWAQLGATGMALALGGSLFLFFRFGRRKRKNDSAACTISTGASDPVAPRAAGSVSTRGTDSTPARTSGSVPIGATGAPSDKTSGAYVPLTRKRSL